jgi:hypothetical protein
MTLQMRASTDEAHTRAVFKNIVIHSKSIGQGGIFGEVSCFVLHTSRRVSLL